jgi:O-antigen/teichoic acid export membrane protein
LAGQVTVSLGLMREHFAYGFRAYVGALFAFTVLRADIILAKLLLGAEATGQYSIAVSMADLVYMLPVAAGTIAFPRLTATEDPAERWAKALSVTKYIALVMVTLAVVAALLARPVVGLLYGEAFLPSVPAFLWLLPGVVMLGVNTILMNYFASIGNPSVVIWSPAIASGVNIALNVILMPRMGVSGAAIASSVAYGFMLLMSAAYVRLRSAPVVT